MSGNIDRIRVELINNSDEKTRLSGERYFKESVRMYGLKSADVSHISKTYFKDLEDKSKTNIFSLCDELWKSGTVSTCFRFLKLYSEKHKDEIIRK